MTYANERRFEIISSNKKERTITFKVWNDNKDFTKYKTINLERETYNYYTNYATNGDWEAFMKTNEYYKYERR